MGVIPPPGTGEAGARTRNDNVNAPIPFATEVHMLSRFAPITAAAALFLAAAAHAQDARLDTARIEQLTGAKGQMNDKEGVFKVSVPRTDLKVTTAGVKMTPPLGLTSWAAFKRVGDHTVVMGDTVMTEEQVNAVMSAAL